MTGDLIPLVIVGAGGFGREILDIVKAANTVAPTYDFLGFLDDGITQSEEVLRLDTRFVGTSADMTMLDTHYLLGIGDGNVRASLDRMFTSLGRTAARVVHPAATIGADSDLAEGLVVAAGARITTNVRSGRHLHVNLNATIGHDCRLGSYVTMMPGANVSGAVVVGDGVTVGTSAAILPGVTVGEHAFIGAGAVVLDDVAAGVTVVGVPARPIGASRKI